MGVLLEQGSHGGSEFGEKKLGIPKNASSDGFVVPENNSFGQSFRDYGAKNERNKTVEEFYRLSHINQTYDFVMKMREAYKKMDRVEMSIWECCELLNDVVDDSDPDLDEPQIEHLLQTAEAIRKDYPNEDWLHLTALIHDLGKVLLLPTFGGLPQWAVVGDTFPLGCAFDEANIHYEFFRDNPDYKNPLYNTKTGVYTDGCGLENVVMSWGHDDYMYLVAKENKTTLPAAGLFIIRYHSFYALHKGDAYKYLMNEEDVENLKWLKIFNKYDLYSKSKVRINVQEVKPYYLSLINKRQNDKNSKRSPCGFSIFNEKDHKAVVVVCEEESKGVSFHSVTQRRKERDLFAIAMSVSTLNIVVASNAKAADNREGRGRTNRLDDKGRRGLLLSAAVAVTQVPESRTELLNKYLKKSQDNKAKNDKERLDSYYKRNYRDYFSSIEGTLRQKNKEELSESEKSILEWLDNNK
ncbi:OLC1v1026425C1 [Oldenlandia corymbosa var. corymbosa]|uniref:inositol oxygenase n=1 Tax=Oldenlandia corymbosa var. corymbosa TaxID=529605 RepID=A0AAV1C7G4_OLDCO|nr:OLC1v1026425C1 [Oldenlandia corymbosa var. corymbosa]